MSWFFSMVAGAAAGVLSGFGIGGGTLLILWLTLVCGFDQFQAGGINLLYFVACAAPALFLHRKHGLLHKRAVKLGILWGLPACAAGALLASLLDVALLRRFFSLFLLFVGIRELLQKSSKNKAG